MVRIEKIHSLLIAALALVFSLGSMAAPTVRCFSDMTHHSVENDYIGINICLMGHRGGVTVIFQEAAGFLEAPVLIEGQFIKDRLTFELPSSALTPGLWKATISKRGMLINNPAGNIYRLKLIAGF